MVYHPVSLKVKKDDISGMRRIASSCPSVMRFVPADSGIAACELRHYSGIDIAALICAPADKAGAPVHMGHESVPFPELISANIAKLGSGHFNYRGIAGPIDIISILGHIGSSSEQHHDHDDAYSNSAAYGQGAEYCLCTPGNACKYSACSACCFIRAGTFDDRKYSL